jgi:hypothetical protein
VPLPLRLSFLKEKGPSYSNAELLLIYKREGNIIDLKTGLYLT